MLKFVARFFYNKSVVSYLKKRKNASFPEFFSPISIVMFLDGSQEASTQELESFLGKSFQVKKHFFVINNVENNILTNYTAQNENVECIGKKDLNFFGLLKKEKRDALQQLSFDVMIDFSDTQLDTTFHDYLVTFINSDFNIAFNPEGNRFYDLTIDSKDEKEPAKRLEILYKYLMMLSGKNYEK